MSDARSTATRTAPWPEERISRKDTKTARARAGVACRPQATRKGASHGPGTATLVQATLFVSLCEIFFFAPLRLCVRFRNQKERRAPTHRVRGVARSTMPDEIGRASCRERVCQYVLISVVPVA